MQNDSDWVNDMFAAAVRDRTWASAQTTIRVIFAPFSRDAEVSSRCESVLSDCERQRVDRFITEEHKHHFIERRAFRRYCGAQALGSPLPLSQIVFNETEKGRPYLPDHLDLWFSFSSCRSGFLGAWSSKHRIGVDIEDKTRNVEPTELAQRFFSEAEAKAVEAADGAESTRTFFQLWCLKEAALKSIGEGMPFGLDAFEFELAPNLRVVQAPHEHGGPDKFDVYVIEETESCAAVVIRSAEAVQE